MRVILLFSLLATLVEGQSPQMTAALSAGSYFPLDVGNRWVYRIDSRFATADYQTWRIDRIDIQNGISYSVMAFSDDTGSLGEAWFRADDQGRVYQPGGSKEVLFLDPTDQPDPRAQLKITGISKTFKTTLGTFPGALFYQNFVNGLVLESGTLAKGVGLVSSTQDMLTGSSGGFVQGRTLAKAALAGGTLHVSLNSPSISVEIESLLLDVTGHNVTNCAVPCYFVACGLVPGADPVGTYKPCARSRVALKNWPDTGDRSVRVQLLAPDGTVIVEQNLAAVTSPDGATFFQLPLYSKPNQPFPAGAYRLRAASGYGSAQASVGILIQ